jgi:predicted PurR-regulated permease PerM
VPRGVATAIVLGGVGVLAAGLLIMVGLLAASQISSLLTHLPKTLASSVTFINNHFHTHLKFTNLQHSLSKINFAHSHLTSLATTSFTQVASLLTGVLFTFYFVAEGPALRDHICSLLPPKSQPEMHRAFDIATQKSGSYFLSRLILSCVRFALALAVLLPAHTPEPFALALWYAVIAEFIPVIGTLIAMLLPVAVALSVSQPSALLVLGVLLAITALRNYVLAPKLSRHTVRLHPALAFAAVISAVVLFGPLAGLFAVPVLATITAFFSTYIHRHDITPQDNPAPGSASQESWADNDPVPEGL